MITKILFSLRFLVVIEALFIFPQYSKSITWVRTNGLCGGYIASIYVQPNGYIFIGTDKGIFRSIDSGINWEECNNGIYPISRITAITENLNGYIFIGNLKSFNKT